jgi:predicted aspartyl protease
MFAAALIRNTLVIGAILAAYPVRGDQAAAIGTSQTHSSISMQVAEGANCSAKPLGELIVATLDNVPFVTLTANGHPVTLILDTGAEGTVLIPATAERIGAQAPQIEFQRQLRGIGGSLPSRQVELQSFAAGGLAMPWRRVAVAPITTARVFSTPLDGLLGDDVLSGFDIDLDLSHQRMRFYDKGACVTAPPWAGPYTVISTGQSRGEHLFFPVKLDGREFSAIIDSGAQHSTVAKSAAQILGVTEAVLERDRPVTTEGATAERLSSRVHQFAQLEVGAGIIPHPVLIVSDLKLQDADVVLGIDFLQSHRIFMSYASLEIFLSK